MLRTLFRTTNEATVALVRVTLGVVMFAHGAQKLLGWFGGYGFEGTMGFFTQSLGVPGVVAAVVILGEFFAGLGLIFGTLTRVSAAGVIAIMLGAVTMVHAQYGFFMNWSGQQAGEGFELHLLVLAMATLLVVKGAGAFSIDRLVDRALAPQAIPVEPRMRQRDLAAR